MTTKLTIPARLSGSLAPIQAPLQIERANQIQYIAFKWGY